LLGFGDPPVFWAGVLQKAVLFLVSLIYRFGLEEKRVGDFHPVVQSILLQKNR
jgi:hypothetical protein